MACMASSTLAKRPEAAAPSIAEPSSTASRSRGNTILHPVASACSRRNTGFLASPPVATNVSMR